MASVPYESAAAYAAMDEEISGVSCASVTVPMIPVRACSLDMMVAGTRASEVPQGNEKGGQAGRLFWSVHDTAYGIVAMQKCLSIYHAANRG
jgi:hypothetical protein